MNVFLAAKLGTFDEFTSLFSQGDEKKLDSGQSLIWFALANADPDEQYKITIFLLNRHASLEGINSEGYGLFHILFSRYHQSVEHFVELAQRLIDRGVDVNKLSKKRRDALVDIIGLPYSDQELAPLYELWLSQDLNNINRKSSFGYTSLELAEKHGSRTGLVRRMKHYLRK